MKNLIKQIIFSMLIVAGIYGCEDYLDVPPDANILEEDIFGNYNSFQGFVDQLYEFLVDYNNHDLCISPNLGGETIGSKPWSSGYMGSYGLYWDLVDANINRSIYVGFPRADTKDGIQGIGIWDMGWRGARICNIALANFDMLTNATPEEKDLIKGQVHFFRAFLHWEIVRAYGSIPYVDTLLNEDNIKMPRFWTYQKNGKTYKNTQAVFERIADDLDIAATLLPEVWDPTELSQGANQPNMGRITKGAALALKAKALLYAGSPLFNEESGGAAEFNKDYMDRAAKAAYEVIKLADKGIYTLAEMDRGVDLDEYRQIFATVDGTFPYGKETILQRIRERIGWLRGGRPQFIYALSRTYSTGQLGGNAVIETPSQNYVDLFEMADGTRYKPGPGSQGGYDDDGDKRWNNRDPRFRKNFWVHGDQLGKVTLQLQVGGKHRTANVKTPYYIHKFWPEGVDMVNQNWGQFTYVTPLLRLSDVYLIYAEAVFEGTGDANAAASGAGLSAVDAVNIIRERAGMPPATANPVAYQSILEGHGESSDDPPFRRLIRNERAVELCFEGNYWWDNRRWKIARKLDKNLYRLDFDNNVTNTSREIVQEYLFEDRHYWLPFLTDLTKMYEGWPQNPGW